MMRTLTLRRLQPEHCCTYVHHEIREGKPSEVHDHDFHELFWIEESEGWHWINGNAIPLSNGDLVLIRAEDAHAFGPKHQGGRLRLINFAFHTRVWTQLRQRYFGSAQVFFSAPTLAARSFRLDETQLAAIRQAASLLRSGLRDRLQAESFLLSVLALLQADRFNAQTSAAPGWIREACSAISLNRQFAGGMPALTRLAGRSPEHIAREFRRYLQRTPTEVINDVRMSHAADRLATSEEEIVAIALDCGLENLGHFYRLFHARYGCTPRAYRLQQRAVVYPLPWEKKRRYPKRGKATV